MAKKQVFVLFCFFPFINFQRERHLSVASCKLLTGNQARELGLCPDWEAASVWCPGRCSNPPAEPHQPGQRNHSRMFGKNKVEVSQTRKNQRNIHQRAQSSVLIRKIKAGQRPGRGCWRRYPQARQEGCWPLLPASHSQRHLGIHTRYTRVCTPLL